MFCTICQCDIDSSSSSTAPSITATPATTNAQEMIDVGDKGEKRLFGGNYGGSGTGIGVSTTISSPNNITTDSTPVQIPDINKINSTTKQETDTDNQDQLPSIHSSRLVLPCGHGFHRSCILKWIHFGHTKCPNCNTQIEELEVKVPIACLDREMMQGYREEKHIEEQERIPKPNDGANKDVGGTEEMKQEEVEEVTLKNANLDEVYSTDPIKVNLSTSLWSVTSLAVQTAASPTAGLRGLSQTGWYNVRLTVVPPKSRKIVSVKYVFHPAFSLNTLEIVSEPFDLVVKLCTKEVKVVVVVSSIPQCKNKHRSSAQKQNSEASTFCFVHTVKKETTTRSYIDPFLNTLDTPTLYSSIDPPTYFQSCLATYNRSPEYYKKTIIPPLRGDRRAKLREYNERGHRMRRSSGAIGNSVGPETQEGGEEMGGMGTYHERDRDLCTVM